LVFANKKLNFTTNHTNLTKKDKIEEDPHAELAKTQRKKKITTENHGVLSQYRLEEVFPEISCQKPTLSAKINSR